MFRFHEHRKAQAFPFFVAGLLLATPTGVAGQAADRVESAVDLVGVGVVDRGRAILLATTGLPSHGHVWRFRSLDTSELPQPIEDVVLARSGTKLFLQSAASAGAVLDLMQEQSRRVPLEYVNPADLAGDAHPGRQSHRLPGQRFVTIRDGLARVIDDSGSVQQDYPSASAVHGAIAGDGVVLYLRPDGAMVICGENDSSRSGCRVLPTRLDGKFVALAARPDRLPGGPGSPRFLLLSGAEPQTYLVDPETGRPRGLPTRRTEAALRACLALNSMAMAERYVAPLADSLIRESAETSAADGHPVTDWRFFRVSPDEELYAPVLELARLETVFPAPFNTVEEVAKRVAPRAPLSDDVLYDRYLRQDVNTRRQDCTLYYRTVSAPGSWIIEYWIYYPFDVGGLGSHVHDPEHMFVEVDKLGSTVRRVIGAGHGYMAGNNVYTVDQPGAHGINLPLYALVELGKHATAPDIDRDGVFTPGVDENEYRERAMIWGVRDVVGTINNQVIAYDTTMSTTRRPQDALALASLKMRFPGEQAFAGTASCRLEAIQFDERAARRPWLSLTDFVVVPPCHENTADCAQRHVTQHPDFLDVRTVMKEWAFPHSFLRATYGIGPGAKKHSVALGYAVDLDRMPAVSKFLPLPGRLGADVFYWHQDPIGPDPDSCVGGRVPRADGELGGCKRAQGVGAGVRYEQFISNLFGIFSAVRVYTLSLADAWITFGPFLEAQLGKHSNVNIEGGLSFRPLPPKDPLSGLMSSGSPRFELRISAGLWKPKTSHVGVRAGTDNDRE